MEEKSTLTVFTGEDNLFRCPTGCLTAFETVLVSAGGQYMGWGPHVAHKTI